MPRTTIDLPVQLERELARRARLERCSEAQLIRALLEEGLERRRGAQPRIPLLDHGLGDPDLARRLDERPDGFGA